jgi:hypothetical protein
MLQMPFQGSKILKFSGGHAHRPPLQISGLRHSPLPKKKKFRKVSATGSLFALLHFATLYSVELFIFVLMCWGTSEPLHPYFFDT